MKKRITQWVAAAWLLAVCWAAAAVAAEPVKFSLAADSRGKEGFVNVMKQLKAAGGPGLFLLTPGDMDPPKTIREQLDGVFGPALMWYPVVGNHELEAKETGPYLREYFDRRLKGKVSPGPNGSEQTTYSFDVGDVHIAVIDVYWNGQPGPGGDKHGGTVVPALREWLKHDLEASSKPWKLVTGHEPAFPQPDQDWKVGRHLGDSLDRDPENRDAFWTLLEQQGVAAYICGHTHRYSRYQPEGSNVWQIDVAQARGDKDWKYDAFVVVTADETSLRFDVYRDLKEEGRFEMTDSLRLSQDRAKISDRRPPPVGRFEITGACPLFVGR